MLGPLMLAGPTLAGDVLVTNYTTPDDGLDDTAGIQAAIDDCQPGDRLLFAPGQYDLFSGAGPHHGLCVASTQDFELHDLEIHGQGARLMLKRFNVNDPTPYQFSGVFTISGVNGLWIHDLEIDMSRAPFSNGTVVNVGASWADVLFDAEFPVTNQVRVEGFYRHYPNDLPWGEGCDFYFANQPTVTALGSQLLRISLPTPFTLATGDKVTVRHRIYGNNGIFATSCSDLTIEDVTIYTIPGIGIVTAGCEDVTLRAVQVLKKPQSQRLMSTTADATHFVTSKGLIQALDCVFEGMGDDGLNVHGYYERVVSVGTNNTIRIVEPPPHWYTLFQPGDVVEFTSPSSLVPFATSTVVSMTPAGTIDGIAKLYDLVLTAVPSGVATNTRLTNASWIPSVEITNTDVLGNRARGFLIQARGVEVTDCLLQDCTGPGINVTCDSYYWNESAGTTNVTIQGCTIERVNGGSQQEFAALTVFAPTGTPWFPTQPGDVGVHSDLALLGNTIQDTECSAIYIGSTLRCLIEGNVFDDVCTDPSSYAETQFALFFETSEDALVTGNVLVGSQGWSQHASSNIVVTGNIGF